MSGHAPNPGDKHLPVAKLARHCCIWRHKASSEIRLREKKNGGKEVPSTNPWVTETTWFFFFMCFFHSPPPKKMENWPNRLRYHDEIMMKHRGLTKQLPKCWYYDQWIRKVKSWGGTLLTIYKNWWLNRTNPFAKNMRKSNWIIFPPLIGYYSKNRLMIYLFHSQAQSLGMERTSLKTQGLPGLARRSAPY